MNYIRKRKKKIILYLFILSTVLFTLRLFLFQEDSTSAIGKKIFIAIIAFISFLIIILFILPARRTLRTFIKEYSDMILFVVFLYIIEYVFLIENNLNYTAITFFAIAFMASICVIVLLIIPKKLKLGVTILITLVLSFYIIFQDIYYAIFSDFASVKDSVSAQAGIEFMEGVIEFEWIHLYYILISFIFIGLMIKFRNDNHLRFSRKNLKILFVPLLIFVLINFNAEYPVNTARLHLSDHYLYKSVYSRQKFVSRFATANFLIRDLVDGAIPNLPNKNDVKDIDAYFEANKKTHEDNDYSDIFADKNLIFIMGESFDEIGINETLTPNIVKMMNEGISFDNYYVPVYPRTTCDSEIIYNTSIIPSITDGPTCFTFNENTYPQSLANLFNEKEYLTNGFHSNEKEFYTRYKVYDGFGYDNFYGQDEIGLNDKNKYFDTIFFETAKDEIVKRDERFLSYVTTLSGHSPYNMDNSVVLEHYDAVDDYYGDNAPEEIKAYVATQIELDLLVKAVFTDLEAKGLLEETVVVLTADHFPYTLPADVYSDFTGIKDLYLKNKSPFTIWSAGITPQKVDKLASSFDVLPTLANMFNLDLDYTYYFGNDIFSNDYQPIVYYKDYSWYDGDNYVLEGTVINGGDGSYSYINNVTVRINEYFEISKKILRTNYYKNKN